MANDEQMKGQWNQLKGEAKKQWGKLTDDELDMVEGQRDKLSGKIQERYGKAKEDADREVDEFIENRANTDNL